MAGSGDPWITLGKQLDAAGKEWQNCLHLEEKCMVKLLNWTGVVLAVVGVWMFVSRFRETIDALAKLKKKQQHLDDDKE